MYKVLAKIFLITQKKKKNYSFKNKREVDRESVNEKANEYENEYEYEELKRTGREEYSLNVDNTHQHYRHSGN
ncbi:hypothetical protein PMLGA01_110041400 [Plasmodium malariae]|uniref:Uncharacterized protein n=1 Tax=Plasmodium malariae TaxID=5858 RepID=A0A1C3KZV4_PLAMA|nr:hypothetical protein PMLGA01_110041400 [Plasmodium malariae]